MTSCKIKKNQVLNEPKWPSPSFHQKVSIFGNKTFGRVSSALLVLKLFQ